MRTVGSISDDILKIKQKEKKLKLQGADLEKERGRLEDELKHAAEAQELTEGGGSKSVFDIEEKTVPQVEDWTEFWAFIGDNNYFHLLQRRAAEKACQELWELGRKIPGVNKFTFAKVNVKEKK